MVWYFTDWHWLVCSLSTGGISLVLGLTPHRFRGLNTIGLVIFLLDLISFLLITFCLLLRFVLYRHTFQKTLTHPKEALFVPTFFLSIAAILTNASTYSSLFFQSSSALDGMATFLRITYWLYIAVTFLVSIIQYHLLFTVKEQRRLTVNAMTPAWILPIFPIMLTGTIAASISPKQPPAQAIAILCSGVAAQGLGMLVSGFMYATYLSRLMVYGLPAQRPGMFIAVGPPSFTCVALIGISNDLPRIFAAAVSSSTASTIASPGLAAAVQQATQNDPALAQLLAGAVQLAALYGALFLWGLSFWFFASALAGVVAGAAGAPPDRRFHLSWWSFVFPNVGFCLSTVQVGHAVGSAGMLWFASVLTVLLVVVWAIVGARCAWAVQKREIVWPGHDEDSD